MKKLPFCIVYTQQSVLLRKISGLLNAQAEIVSPKNCVELFTTLEQHDPAVVILDIFSARSASILARITEERPRSIVIVLGEERSAPILAAQRVGVFATESPECSRSRFQSLVQIAFRHIEVVQEAEMMRQALAVNGAKVSQPEKFLSGETHVREALRSFTQSQDLPTLLVRSMEWLRSYKGLGSVAVFLQAAPEGPFSLSSSVKCPKEVAKLSFSMEDPWVEWLRYHPSIISRQALGEIADRTVQRRLSRALQVLFADAIFPLHGAEGLLGWIVIGAGATGRALSEGDLAEIGLITDYLTFVIEKSLVDQRNEAQRLQFESLLQTLSSGIVLFNKDLQIAWLNLAASRIFQSPTEKLFGKRPESLGSKLSAFVRRGLSRPFDSATMRWSPAASGRKFLVEVHPCVKDGVLQSGFMLMQDITPEILLEENNRKVQCAEIATKLASHLSAEIRNPLVAIKTFVQLLPERYQDTRFRQRFINLVSHEVERLSVLSTGISDIVFNQTVNVDVKGFDLRDVVNKAVTSAIERSKLQDGQIKTMIDPKPSPMLGDKEGLVECFTQIITLLIESERLGPSPALCISLSVDRGGDDKPRCTVNFEGKLATSKATFNKGSDQTLPLWGDWSDLDFDLAKRTITSHSGQLKFGCPGKAGYVMIELPLKS